MCLSKIYGLNTDILTSDVVTYFTNMLNELSQCELHTFWKEKKSKASQHLNLELDGFWGKYF